MTAKEKRETRAIAREMERRYGYFPGEHPNRGKVRLTIETEPMARWLAEAEIRREIAEKRAIEREDANA